MILAFSNSICSFIFISFPSMFSFCWRKWIRKKVDLRNIKENLLIYFINLKYWIKFFKYFFNSLFGRKESIILKNVHYKNKVSKIKFFALNFVDRLISSQGLQENVSEVESFKVQSEPKIFASYSAILGLIGRILPPKVS